MGRCSEREGACNCILHPRHSLLFKSFFVDVVRCVLDQRLRTGRVARSINQSVGELGLRPDHRNIKLDRIPGSLFLSSSPLVTLNVCPPIRPALHSTAEPQSA